MDRLWQAYLRRFDLEHTFRMLKQTLGWTRPRLRDPNAADTWTWLVIAAHTQLRLAREQVEDLRRPWERPVEPRRLTPARVRRGFTNIRPTLALPTGARDTRDVEWLEKARQAERREDWDTAISLVSAHAECYSADHHAHNNHLWHMDLLARAGRLDELTRLARSDVHARRRLRANKAQLAG